MKYQNTYDRYDRAVTVLSEISNRNKLSNNLDFYLYVLALWGMGKRAKKPNPEDYGIETEE